MNLPGIEKRPALHGRAVSLQNGLILLRGSVFFGCFYYSKYLTLCILSSVGAVWMKEPTWLHCARNVMDNTMPPPVRAGKNNMLYRNLFYMGKGC